MVLKSCIVHNQVDSLLLDTAKELWDLTVQALVSILYLYKGSKSLN